MKWTEIELYRWACALDVVSLTVESEKEASFFRLWEDDVQNSPPTNELRALLGLHD